MPRAGRGGEESDAGFRVGDRVQAVSPDDEQRYPGTVEGTNDDGTYVVKWDDPDGGPETNDIEAGDMQKIVVFRDYVVGDDVAAISEDDGRWYLGAVVAVNTDGTFQVRWDDPNGGVVAAIVGAETATVKAEEMKKVTVFKGYKVDDAVEALYPEDGQMYPGTVLKANGDGTFQVRWDDADGGPEDSAVSPKNMRYPPIPFEKLERGQKYTGTVRRVLEWGAWVDIGAVSDGLLHISRVAEGRVDSIHDHVEVDQEVEVWISELRSDGKFGLTMVRSKISGGGAPRSKPDLSARLSAFVDVSPDEWLDGTVARLAPFGAFVTLSSPDGEAIVDGLVHLSEVRDGFVESIEDELQVGQEVKVRVKSVAVEQGKLSLSMKQPFVGGGGRAPREPADFSAFEGISSDQWLTGKVARTAAFGAFVRVAAEDGTEADGLLHITQIRDGFVERVEDELEPGQEVQVRLVSLDVGAGKMGLSMKSAELDE